MSATGDHQLVRDRIPYCQRLVMKGAMHQVKKDISDISHGRTFNTLNMIPTDCDHVSQRSRRNCPVLNRFSNFRIFPHFMKKVPFSQC